MPATPAERGDSETETIARDAVQPEVDSQPLPAGNSKNIRPRARPLKRAATQAHVTSDSPLQAQDIDQIQPTASEVAVVGAVETGHPSPPTQGVENEASHGDTPRLSQKRPNLTLHQVNHADKRQKISDQSQSEEVAETMNRSALNAAAKGNYILMA